MPSFLRFATLTALLLAVSTPGKAQGLVPQPQIAPQSRPAYSMPGSGYPAGGFPATGYPAGGMQQERMSIVDPDKKLSAGDQVTVEIVEDREGGLPRMVTAGGELDVPPLGRIKVAGHTVTEAAAEIKQLLERDYYYHATVRLSIDRVSPVSVRAGLIYLSGEVRLVGPQEMVAGEPVTLANAILKAGGLGPWGNGEKVKLMRQRNGVTQTTIVNYDKVIKTGDVKSDPVLEDGDRIFVPKKLYQF
jgi:protein involved in polysaccharide export with SLBB domain